MRNLTLLSVDWDYFCITKETDPDEWQFYDWGHSESFGTQLQGALWNVRQGMFERHGKTLPGVDSGYREFWDRFTYNPEAKLYIANSHCQACDVDVLKDVRSVINVDAHHDAGYRKGAYQNVFDTMKVTCEDWMLGANISGVTEFEQVYPTWLAKELHVLPEENIIGLDLKEPEEVYGRRVDRVFVAKSPSWTPPWNDHHFLAFVRSCPLELVVLDDNPLIQRNGEFDGNES